MRQLLQEYYKIYERTWKTYCCSEPLTDKIPFILYKSSPFSSISLSSQSSTCSLQNKILDDTKQTKRIGSKENKYTFLGITIYLIKVKRSFRNNCNTWYSRIVHVVMMMPFMVPCNIQTKWCDGPNKIQEKLTLEIMQLSNVLYICQKYKCQHCIAPKSKFKFNEVIKHRT